MPPNPGGNYLLSRLPSTERRDIDKNLKLVQLEVGQVLYEARAPIEYSYFPVSGTLSAVTVLAAGSMIEVAQVGREGATGLPAFVQAQTSPHRVFYQIPSEAYRIATRLLEKLAVNGGPLRKVLHNYHAAFTFQISQSVACNGLHGLVERCCRWLLMSLEHSDTDEILLTHELLSIMLGVRRSGVTESLQVLKSKGIISLGRGRIRVLNAQALRREACECYEAVRAEYTRLLGAIRMGIARALLAVDTETFNTLRGGGFLTRDSRMKERKHYGLRGARRGTQFSKR